MIWIYAQLKVNNLYSHRIAVGTDFQHHHVNNQHACEITNMPCYTCTTENRSQSHISQHSTDNPEKALRDHIKLLPFFNGINPIGDELYWLQNIALGKCEITLGPAKRCEQAWIWVEGQSYSPSYTTYIIKTDTSD